MRGRRTSSVLADVDRDGWSGSLKYHVKVTVTSVADDVGE